MFQGGKLVQIDKAVEQFESLTVEQWRQRTRGWTELNKEIARQMRLLDSEFRKSKAEEVRKIDPGPGGILLQLLSLLSNDALDRVIESFP